MCGIFGYIAKHGRGPDLARLRRIALETETRGRHAFGLAWLDRALALYRDNYKPSALHPKPQCTICVFALAADTEAEALFQFKSRERAMIEREFGIRRTLTSPEEAAKHVLSPHEQAFSKKLLEHAIVGSAEQVKSRLDALARRLDLEELVIVTWTYDQAPRMRSYELLAEAYGLKK